MSSVPAVPTTGAAPINPGIIAGSAVAVIVVAAILAMLFVGAEGHFGPKVTEGGEDDTDQTTMTMAKWLESFRNNWIHDEEKVETFKDLSSEDLQKVNAQLSRLGLTFKPAAQPASATSADESVAGSSAEASPLVGKITETWFGRFKLGFQKKADIEALSLEVNGKIQEIVNPTLSGEVDPSAAASPSVQEDSGSEDAPATHDSGVTPTGSV